jgi:hypothetical protein
MRVASCSGDRRLRAATRGLIAAPWTPASLLLCSRRNRPLGSVPACRYSEMRMPNETENPGWF